MDTFEFFDGCSRRDCQRGEITTQVVEYKLTGNEERNNNQEKVPTSMYADVQKIIQEIGQNRAETQRRLVVMCQKLTGLEENIRNEISTIANTLIQNRKEQEPKTKKESRVSESPQEIPFFGKLK